MTKLDSVVLNGTEYDLGGADGDLSTKADLPYTRSKVTLSVLKGHMLKSLSVFGTQYLYTSFSVTSGQKFLITGWCQSKSAPCAFTVDANNTVTELLNTVGTTYENEEITIPEGAVTLYINGTADNKISAILLGARITQSEFDEKIHSIDTLKDQSDIKADLTYDLTPIEITVEQGWISKSLTVYGNDNQKHTSISVNAGEKYAITGGTNASTYPTAFCTDANNNVTVLNSDGYCFKQIVTIPDGATTLYVNNSSEGLIGIFTPTRITQSQFSDKVKKIDGKAPNLILYYSSAGVRVKRKYDAEKDLMITMKNTGPNNLFNFVKAGFVNNTEDEPNERFGNYTGISDWTASSDCLGPYIVAAVNNIDGDTPTAQEFTGGNHQTSGGAITAVPQSLSVLVNGVKEAEQGIFYPCEFVVIKWVNLIQAYNTTKSDGTGRGVMTESWEAVIDRDRVKLRNKITALEDIVLHRYYGFQINPQGNYYFEGGADRKVFTAASGSGSGNSGNNTCRKMTIVRSGFNTDIAIDPVDLGLFEYNNGYSFFASNGKLYSSLIHDSKPLSLSTGSSCFLEGYYRFY